MRISERVENWLLFVGGLAVGAAIGTLVSHFFKGWLNEHFPNGPDQ